MRGTDGSTRPSGRPSRSPAVVTRACMVPGRRCAPSSATRMTGGDAC